MYRYTKDKKYGGYSIQKRHQFLWFEWWSDEYLTTDKEEAERLKNKLNN